MDKTFRLSSNITLFLKIFLPTFWIVFFGMFCIMAIVIPEETMPFFRQTTVRISILALFFVFFLLFYFTIMSLKRVDASKEHIYISNYFKSYRYKLEDIETTKELDFGIINVVRLVLKEKGKMGRKPFFLLNAATFNAYLEKYPENFQYFTLKSMSRSDK